MKSMVRQHLEQVYQHKSLLSPFWAIRCDIYYEAHSNISDLPPWLFTFYKNMAYETASRWSRAIVWPSYSGHSAHGSPLHGVPHGVLL
jgi:hypothetical protein